MTLFHAARRWPLWVACLLALVPASASALVILETSRRISIGTADLDPYGNPMLKSISTVDPIGYGPWSAALADGTAGASQSSLIDQAELSGAGSVAALVWWESGSTRYHVVFSVDSATPYALSVDNVDAGFASMGSPAEPGGSVQLKRVNPANFGTVLQTIHSITLGRNTYTGEGLPDFSGDGLLEPGTYALDFLLGKPPSHWYADNGAAGFSFTVVPEPQTSLLLLLGLIGLSAGSRGRARGENAAEESGPRASRGVPGVRRRRGSCRRASGA